MALALAQPDKKYNLPHIVLLPFVSSRSIETLIELFYDNFMQANPLFF